jgi:polyisoprenoid-binding protein YceI
LEGSGIDVDLAALRFSQEDRMSSNNHRSIWFQRIVFASALGVASASLAACDNNPTKDKVKADVAEPVKTATAPVANARTYAFSQDGSKFEWVGAKVTGKHDGGFKVFSGTIQVPDGKIESGSVTVDVDTTSVFSDTDKLTVHLKSADFFDVEKFPKARFVSTSVTPGGAAGATHTVTGNLELHGVTKSISFPAKISVSDSEASVDAEFGLNRKDFGILYTGKADDLIKDDVLIKLDIDAKAKPAQ